jgi:hypothetical protein
MKKPASLDTAFSSPRKKAKTDAKSPARGPGVLDGAIAAL